MFLHMSVILFTGASWLPSMHQRQTHWMNTLPDADIPPQDTWHTMGYGQQGGGAHPTGKHSCFKVL